MDTNTGAALLVCCMGILLVLSLLSLAFFAPKYYQQKRSLAALQYRYNVLSSSAMDDMRLRWLQELPHHRYRNEIEVEVNFIYPMLRFLGYDQADLHIREDVPIQIGRQEQIPEADWVITKDNKPFFVIEAKRQEQTITREVLLQARSYTYGLNLDMYMVTNGRTLELWSRGTQGDTQILCFPVDEIGIHWERLKQVIGKQ